MSYAYQVMNNLKKYEKIFYVVFFILFFLLIFLILSKEGIYLYGDAATPFGLNHYSLPFFSTWDAHNFLGYNSTLIVLPRITYYLLHDFLLFLTNSTYLTQVLIYFILFLFGYFSFYRFISKNTNNKHAYFLSFIGVLNFYVIDRLTHIHILMAYFAMPLALSFMQDYFKLKKIKYAVLFGLCILFIMVALHELYLFLILMVIWFLTSIKISKQNYIEQIKKIFITFLITFLLLSFFIIPLLYSFTLSNPLSHVAKNWNDAIYYYSQHAFIFNTVRFTGYLGSSIKIENPLINIISFFLPLATFLAFYCKGKLNWKIMYLIGILLSSVTTISAPLTAYLKIHLPLFSVISDSTYFVPIIILPSLVLIAHVVNSQKKYYQIFLIFFFSIIIINFYYFNNSFIKDAIPSEYLSSAKNVKNNFSTRILVLPLGWVENFSWASNIYSGFINNLLYPRSLVGQRAVEFMTNESNTFSVSLENKFYKNKLSLDDLINLNISEIIILRKNVATLIDTVPVDFMPDYKSIKFFLDKYKNVLEKKISNKYIELYSLPSRYIKPLISSNNITFSKINDAKYQINFNGIKDIQKLSFFNTYNPGWKLYPIQNNEKNNNACNSITIYSNNTSECIDNTNIRYIDLSDVKYSIKNDIFRQSHHVADIYANGWMIDPTHIKNNISTKYWTYAKNGGINISFIMYFSPQSYFYLGLIISVTTLIVCLSFLIYMRINFLKSHNNV